MSSVSDLNLHLKSARKAKTKQALISIIDSVTKIYNELNAFDLPDSGNWQEEFKRVVKNIKDSTATHVSRSERLSSMRGDLVDVIHTYNGRISCYAK